MERILTKTIEFYCDNQVNNFKQSDLYKNLVKQVQKTDFNIVLEVGPEYNKPNSYNRFMSISIFDSKNHLVELPDEGNLTTATQIVFVDKKNRFIFLEWNDEEFIEDINWIMENIQIIDK